MHTSEQKEQIIGMICTALTQSTDQTTPPSTEQVHAMAKRLEMAYPELKPRDWLDITREVKSRVRVTMDPGTLLTSHTYRDWLADARRDITWTRWLAYKNYLRNNNMPGTVVNVIDNITDDILNCMGDPTETGQWSRRGLVIGDVQSGKTATYLAAVNKAADAGYRLIVLLAGGTEELRKQTQYRVDEGFLGFDSSTKTETVAQLRTIGVGKSHTGPAPICLTTQETDFRKTSKQSISLKMEPNSQSPYVFVIKKNKTSLQNLRDWLLGQTHQGERIDIPMLLVDDESDYASVNTTSGDNSPTKINQLIRQVLKTSSRTSYLAFTATPFANVFIDHETDNATLGNDLFPNDYIRTLEAPSNYCGSGFYFGSDEKATSEHLNDPEDAEEYFPLKHRSNWSVDSLPPSMHEAIRTYVLASAIREARGDTRPRSMLINVSRFKNVQQQVHALVDTAFDQVRNAIELHASAEGPAPEHPVLRSLKQTFDAEYSKVPESWEDVSLHLLAAVQGNTVALVNSDRAKSSNDTDNINNSRMIAIGGDVLSRGLTLEGLVISYFYRSVGAADTLLQMARWFGYRDDYSDLCRVWISENNADQFRYVAGIVQELRDQLRQMKRNGQTPREFGLMVRKHPESLLLVTARNKMRAAEERQFTVDIYGRKNIETSKIPSDSKSLLNNQEALERFLDQVKNRAGEDAWQTSSRGLLTASGVPAELVARFLSDYRGWDPLFSDSAVATFIKSTRRPILRAWDVVFVPGSGDEAELSGVALPSTIVRAMKLGTPVQSPSTGASLNAYRVSGDRVRLAGSSDVARAGDVPADAPQSEPSVYHYVNRPILLIYVMTPRTVDEKTGRQWETNVNDGVKYVIGVKLALPRPKGAEGTHFESYEEGPTFFLNSVALTLWRGISIEDTSDDDFEYLDGVDYE